MFDVQALPPEGWSASWQDWDGNDHEQLTLSWENEAWTASGIVASAGVQYVLRLSPLWTVRQFLLFRDLDEPDLWLATDSDGRWGEMNGVYRPEFDRSIDIHLPCTPFTTTLPLRRLPHLPGSDAGVLAAPTIEIDVETLDAVATTAVLTQLGDRQWQRRDHNGTTVVDVDEYGFAIDVEGRFRRV